MEFRPGILFLRVLISPRTYSDVMVISSYGGIMRIKLQDQVTCVYVAWKLDGGEVLRELSFVCVCQYICIRNVGVGSLNEQWDGEGFHLA